MPYEEFLGWQSYFDARPVDWREDDRTMKLLQVQGVKEKPYEVFQSLKQIKEHQEATREKLTDGFVPTNAIRGSMLAMMLGGAKGGDNLGDLVK